MLLFLRANNLQILSFKVDIILFSFYSLVLFYLALIINALLFFTERHNSKTQIYFCFRTKSSKIFNKFIQEINNTNMIY